MSTETEPVIIETMRGRDGKRYPPNLPVDQHEYQAFVRRVHKLCCTSGLSQRQAQRVLLSSGIRRSTGAIARAILTFQCPDCRDHG